MWVPLSQTCCFSFHRGRQQWIRVCRRISFPPYNQGDVYGKKVDYLARNIVSIHHIDLLLMEVCSLCGCFVCSITLSKIWKHDKGSWSVRKNSMQDPLRWKPSQRCQRYYKNHEICVRGYYDILQHMIVYCFLVVLTKVHLLWLFPGWEGTAEEAKSSILSARQSKREGYKECKKVELEGLCFPWGGVCMWCLFMKIAMMGEVIQAQFIGASFWLTVCFWSSIDIMIRKWTWMDLMIFPPIMALNQDTQLPWFFLAVFIVGTSTTSGSF